MLNKILLYCLCFANFSLYATRDGGEIFYEYLGDKPGYQTGDYRVYATVFADTGFYQDIGTPPAFHVFSAGNYVESVPSTYYSHPNSMTPGLQIQPGDPYGWLNTPYYGGVFNYNWEAPYFGQGCAGTRRVIEARYSAIINLPQGIHEIYFNEACCRFEDNIASGNRLSLKATINNHSHYKNNSVRFLTPSNLKLCMGNNLSLKFSQWGKETDGDSVAYSFRIARTNTSVDTVAPIPATYKQGFSANQQLPSAITQTINSRTGEITLMPNDTGKFSLVVEAAEYRNDTFTIHWLPIGTVVREIPIEIVDSCHQIKNPQHNFTTINPYDLHFETIIRTDSGSGDVAHLNWNNQEVNRTPTADSSWHILRHNLQLPLLSTPFKYEVSASDWCGRSLTPDTTHQTIAVSISQSNISWTPYIGRAVQEYRVYWMDSTRQSAHIIDSVNGNSTQISRGNLPATAYYILVEGVLADSTLLPANWNYAGPLGLNLIPGKPFIGSAEAESPTLEIYPNPASQQLNVSLHLPGKVAYEITASSGQQVQRGTLRAGENQIDLSPIKSGVYFLRLDNGEVRRFVKR